MDTTANTTITTKITNMLIEMLLFVIHKSTNTNLLKYVEVSAHSVDLSRDYLRMIRTFQRRERHLDDLQKLQRILYFVR
jgi:hypothetical protein